MESDPRYLYTSKTYVIYAIYSFSVTVRISELERGIPISRINLSSDSLTFRYVVLVQTVDEER